MEMLLSVLMFLIPIIMLISLVSAVWYLIRKNKSKFIGSSIVLVISLIGFFALEGTEFWKVDSCLDSGGRYDYEQGKCRH
jgi:hypothetical protein